MNQISSAYLDLFCNFSLLRIFLKYFFIIYIKVRNSIFFMPLFYPQIILLRSCELQLYCDLYSSWGHLT